MIPFKNHPKWAALLDGRVDHKFSNPAGSLLLWRLRCDLRRDNSSAALARAIDELHAFCSKYEAVIQPDLKAIFN